MNCQADKTKFLAAFFGRRVTVTENSVHLRAVLCPIFDRVIVLLPPEKWVGKLAGDGGAFAPDIQAAFGAEGKTHSDIGPDHVAKFRRLYGLVALDRSRARIDQNVLHDSGRHRYAPGRLHDGEALPYRHFLCQE